MVYIYFVQEAFLAQLRFHGDTLVNYLILRFVLHINRHLKSRKERNPRASAKFSIQSLSHHHHRLTAALCDVNK